MSVEERAEREGKAGKFEGEEVQERRREVWRVWGVLADTKAVTG